MTGGRGRGGERARGHRGGGDGSDRVTTGMGVFADATFEALVVDFGRGNVGIAVGAAGMATSGIAGSAGAGAGADATGVGEGAIMVGRADSGA